MKIMTSLHTCRREGHFGVPPLKPISAKLRVSGKLRSFHLLVAFFKKFVNIFSRSIRPQSTPLRLHQLKISDPRYGKIKTPSSPLENWRLMYDFTRERTVFTCYLFIYFHAVQHVDHVERNPSRLLALKIIRLEIEESDQIVNKNILRKQSDKNFQQKSERLRCTTRFIIHGIAELLVNKSIHSHHIIKYLQVK